MKTGLIAATLGVLLSAPAVGGETLPEIYTTPSSLQEEHRHLQDTLQRAQQERGEIGEAAERLTAQLQPHFAKEERWALPQLALLEPLSQGNVSGDMQPAVEMAERLKAEYPVMLKEHEAIREAVGRLRQVAAGAGKTEYVAFADALALHAMNEEQILYPAAILVGEYLKVQLPGQRGNYAHR